MNVQYGCGLSAPAGWENFDSSPTLRLQRLPLVGRCFLAGQPKFPKSVRWGNIVHGLPLGQNQADHAYCSHVLEHLALDELRRALANTRSLLKPGGVFRLVMPDLELLVKGYVGSSEEDRGIKFIRDTLMGYEFRKHGAGAFLREWLGGSRHLWLWDFAGVRSELRTAGFTAVRRASLGDSGIRDFDVVENPERWQLALGVECRKSG